MLYVTLAPVSVDGAVRQPELAAVTLDGRAARATPAGFETRPLTGEELAAIRAALSHQGELSDAYVMSGQTPEPRWQLTLGKEASRREITADLPLANASMPEPLYRLFLSLERLRYSDGTWTPLEPAAVRVWLVPSPNETRDAEPTPAWLDDVTASSRDGQTVVVAELSEAERAWFSEIRPRLVALSDGRTATFTWSIDWSAWAQSGP